MKKNHMKYLVDTLLFLCMVGTAFIGFLMAFFLAEGPAGRLSRKYFLGLHRHQWGDIHLYLSIMFSILVVIHLLLSWKWIKCQAEHLFKRHWKAALILTLAASVILMGVFWILLPKHSSSYNDYGTRLRSDLPPRFQGNKPTADAGPERLTGSESPENAAARAAVSGTHLPAAKPGSQAYGRLSQEDSGIMITGQMTLLDIERQTGVSTASLLSRMNLPADTPRSEPLGRLRRHYGFSIIQLREALESLMKKD